jgi:DNA-binding response OmpR family regulator
MRRPILVVESNPKAGAEVARLLDQAGYSSLVVDTVPAGLQILRADTPSLIITASRVDGYNGLQLIAMAPRPIPAIVLAASTDPFFEIEARRLGADGLVTPTAAVLLAVVARKRAPAATPANSVRLRRGHASA